MIGELGKAEISGIWIWRGQGRVRGGAEHLLVGQTLWLARLTSYFNPNRELLSVFLSFERLRESREDKYLYVAKAVFKPQSSDLAAFM